MLRAGPEIWRIVKTRVDVGPAGLRPQEGDHGCRSIHSYRRLPHAQGWDDVQGPWLQSLRSPFHRPAEKPPDQTPGRSWLRGADQAALRLRRRPGVSGTASK